MGDQNCLVSIQITAASKAYFSAPSANPARMYACRPTRVSMLNNIEKTDMAFSSFTQRRLAQRLRVRLNFLARAQLTQEITGQLLTPRSRAGLMVTHEGSDGKA